MENNEYHSLMTTVSDLSKRIDEVLDGLSKSQHMPHRSTEIKDLATALAKAQGEMEIAVPRSENPYFKSSYADLNEIVRASRPALAKFGLSVMQPILPNDDGQMILHTVLSHSSGQWIESRMRILPPKSDVQSLGSYITYLRRYAYSALLGVTTGDEDDDGEIAVATTRQTFAKGTALNNKYNPKENKLETITKEQVEALEYELSSYPDVAEQVLDGLKIQNLADMPKAKFQAAITRIRQIKLVREEGKE